MDSRAMLRRPKTLERTKTRPSHKQFRSMHMLAWSSLLLAVGVLLSAIVLVPRGVSSILAGVSESKATTAEIIDGTVLFQPPATANWQSMPAQKNLSEGSRVRTDDRSRVFLRTRDGSTLLLYNDTELALQRMQFGRFNKALQDTVIRIFRGRLQIGVAAHPSSQTRQITVLSGIGRFDLSEGSYRIEMDPDGSSHLSIRSGYASIWSGNQSVNLPAGFRARIGPKGKIHAPLPLERDLIDDPLRDAALDDSPWKTFVVTEAGPAGTIKRSTTGVWFHRTTQAGKTDRHGESGLSHKMDTDIRDYVNLTIGADVRINSQTLSGGGTAGTEYPLMIRITYLDTDGQEQIWTTGFYHQNTDGLSVKMGREIPANKWITYTNSSLLQEIRPAPVHLRRIEILGSGWEYISGVRRMELTGH